MSVYLKFLRLFLVLIVGVFFLVGSGGGGGGDDTPVTPEPITVLDSTEETISNQEIKTLLENNETTYTKSFTLDDKKTEVKLSFDLLENNVTKDVKIDVESLDYKEGELWAKILSFSSSVPLTNVSIEALNNKTVSQKVSRKVTKENKIIVASMGEAPISFSFESNFLDILYDLKLNSKNNKYSLSAKLKSKIKRLQLQVFDNEKNELSNDSISNTKNIQISFNKIDERYNVNFYITAPPYYNNRISLFSLVCTTDFVPSKAILSKKTLSQTRVNESDVLNNFMESDERKYPFAMEETTTHRITDFDKLLTNETIILSKTGWKNSSYTSKGDNGRMPLILVHGWNGDKDMRDPSKLLLWKNSEYEYWHKFISFYLSSEKLQKKYHLYLYRYPSYKHIAYNAKILKKLLEEIPSNTDLGKGFQKDENGITIMAHSMGGMVSRSMIEDFKGLGENAETLKKLITLDTPHRGSVGSMDNLLTNTPKDLDTHGAMDLNYDNVDGKFSALELKKFYNKRRSKNGLNNFDKVYCNKLNMTYEACMNNTANPYMKFLNDNLSNNNYHSKKYIFYTAWTVTGLEKIVEPLYGTLLQDTQNLILDLSYNNIPDLNYLNNKLMGISTAFMGKYGYSAGGAETIGSSIFSSNKYPSFFNPKYNEAPSISTLSTNDLYHKDLLLNNICMYTVKNLNNESVCIDKRNLNLALIISSVGNDHPYKIPYRLFWDYDHDTIFQGADSLGNRNSWDGYINQASTVQNTDKDTQFYSHRTDYVQGAMKIRYGQEVENVSSDYANTLNPLKYEPVFLVIEKDLLTSVTNDDIDEDGMKDTWEIENGLRFVNASDANEDSDHDGLTNLQEYNDGNNSTDPQNEDSDGDGFKDGDEVTAGTNPNDKKDYPKEKVEFPLTLDSKTSTHFNLSWTAPTGATKYKLCQSSIDEVSYYTAQTCNNLVDGYFFDVTTSSNMSIKSDATGNVLQQNTTYYFRVVAYNDPDEVVGVSSLVSDKLGSQQTSTSKLKKTGQTKSYDTDGNEVTDGSVKDDGYYQKGVIKSYTTNSTTGVIVDNITGLMWQRYVPKIWKPWVTKENYDLQNYTDTSGDTATNYCNTLTLAGYSDWRVPNITELQGLILDGNSPSVPLNFVGQTGNTWSSTTTVDGYNVWTINMDSGYTVRGYMNNSLSVRCVR